MWQWKANETKLQGTPRVHSWEHSPTVSLWGQRWGCPGPGHLLQTQLDLGPCLPLPPTSGVNLSKALHFLCLRFLHIWWGSWHLPGRVVARMRGNHTKSKGLSNHDLLKYNLTVYKLYSSLWELWPEVNPYGVYTLAGARVNTYTQTIPTNTPQTPSLSREQLFGIYRLTEC